MAENGLVTFLQEQVLAAQKERDDARQVAEHVVKTAMRCFEPRNGHQDIDLTIITELRERVSLLEKRLEESARGRPQHRMVVSAYSDRHQRDATPPTLGHCHRISKYDNFSQLKEQNSSNSSSCSSDASYRSSGGSDIEAPRSKRAYTTISAISKHDNKSKWDELGPWPGLGSAEEGGEKEVLPSHSDLGKQIEENQSRSAGHLSFQQLPSSFFKNGGVCYEPPPGVPQARRTLVLSGIPLGTNPSTMTEEVAGGTLVSIKLLKIHPITSYLTAIVECLYEKTAGEYFEFRQEHPLILAGQRVSVQLLETPTWPLDQKMLHNMLNEGRTRCIEVRHLSPSYQDNMLFEELQSGLFSAYHGVEYEVSDYDTLKLRFMSVDAAGRAFDLLTRSKTFSKCHIFFTPDPCARPLSTLLHNNTTIALSIRRFRGYEDRDDVGVVKLEHLNYGDGLLSACEEELEALTRSACLADYKQICPRALLRSDGSNGPVTQLTGAAYPSDSLVTFDNEIGEVISTNGNMFDGDYKSIIQDAAVNLGRGRRIVNYSDLDDSTGRLPLVDCFRGDVIQEEGSGDGEIREDVCMEEEDCLLLEY